VAGKRARATKGTRAKKKTAASTSPSFDLRCSFCGKEQAEVRKLIAGPNVYICDECIMLCLDIFAEEYRDNRKAREGDQVLAQLPDGSVRGLRITEWFRTDGDENVFEWSCAEAEDARWLCVRKLGGLDAVQAVPLDTSVPATRAATMKLASEVAGRIFPASTLRPTAATWVAEELVVFAYPDGRRARGRIAIGLPYDVGGGESRCRVVLDFIPVDHPISGTTPLQALLLAVRFAGTMLAHFLESGGKVLDADGEDIALDAIFGPLLVVPSGRA
jgi:hypothetical protein